jgi:hypothetical protein
MARPRVLVALLGQEPANLRHPLRAEHRTRVDVIQAVFLDRLQGRDQNRMRLQLAGRRIEGQLDGASASEDVGLEALDVFTERP